MNCDLTVLTMTTLSEIRYEINSGIRRSLKWPQGQLQITLLCNVLIQVDTEIKKNHFLPFQVLLVKMSVSSRRINNLSEWPHFSGKCVTCQRNLHALQSFAKIYVWECQCLGSFLSDKVLANTKLLCNPSEASLHMIIYNSTYCTQIMSSPFCFCPFWQNA